MLETTELTINRNRKIVAPVRSFRFKYRIRRGGTRRDERPSETSRITTMSDNRYPLIYGRELREPYVY